LFSATSRLLDQLVRRKLIKRIEDPEDRRARRVSLSERGARLAEELTARRTDAQLDLMERLDETERAKVFEAFALLAEATRRKRASDGG
jgi:MarR family transcriptional regulator for hemolysin